MNMLSLRVSSVKVLACMMMCIIPKIYAGYGDRDVLRSITIDHVAFIKEDAILDPIADPIPSLIDLTFSSFGSVFKVNLKLSQDVVGNESSIDVYEDDQVVFSKPIGPKRVFEGKVYIYNNGTLYKPSTSHKVSTNTMCVGWIRVYVNKIVPPYIMMEGTISLDDNLYNIKPRFSSSDFNDLDGISLLMMEKVYFDDASTMCGHDSLHFQDTPETLEESEDPVLVAHDKISDIYLHTIDEHRISNIRKGREIASGCPTFTKILYMGVAVDCSYSSLFEHNVHKIEESIIKTWNIISGIYENEFNIKIGIIKLNIMNSCSKQESPTRWNIPCSPDYTLSDKLNDFSRWRGEQDSRAGLWHLLSGCTNGKVVGIAWLNQLCNTKAFKPSNTNNYVSGTGVSVLIKNMYAVIAHEIGHNFGAIHDCVQENCIGKKSHSEITNCCPCITCDCKGKYIMSPENGGLSPTSFSLCSKYDICRKNPFFGKCLQIPGKINVINSNICGNGIKESGEECDCGSPEECKRTLAVCKDANSGKVPCAATEMKDVVKVARSFQGRKRKDVRNPRVNVNYRVFVTEKAQNVLIP